MSATPYATRDAPTVITDDIPTHNSTNLVTSGGMYDALLDKEQVLTFENELAFTSPSGLIERVANTVHFTPPNLSIFALNSQLASYVLLSTLTSTLSSYLTLASADTTYLTQSNAGSTYTTLTTFNDAIVDVGTALGDKEVVLTFNNLSPVGSGSISRSGPTISYTPPDLSIYALTASLSNYLTTVSASSIYLSQANATSTYATISSLSNYLTIANASSIYATISSLSNYLTTADASSTYATITELNTKEERLNFGTALDEYSLGGLLKRVGNNIIFVPMNSSRIVYDTELELILQDYLTIATASSTYTPLTTFNQALIDFGLALNDKENILTFTNNIITPFQSGKIERSGNTITYTVPDLSPYATIADYVSNSSLSSTLSNYLTTSLISANFVSNATYSVGISDIYNNFTNYLTTSAASTTYAPIITPTFNTNITTPKLNISGYGASLIDFTADSKMNIRNYIYANGIGGNDFLKGLSFLGNGGNNDSGFIGIRKGGNNSVSYVTMESSRVLSLSSSVDVNISGPNVNILNPTNGVAMNFSNDNRLKIANYTYATGPANSFIKGITITGDGINNDTCEIGVLKEVNSTVSHLRIISSRVTEIVAIRSLYLTGLENIIANKQIDMGSDSRIKFNVKNVETDSLALIKKLNLKHYDKVAKLGETPDTAKSHHEIGYIAQEVELIEDNECCCGSVEQDILYGLRTINYSTLFLHGLNATKQLEKIVKLQGDMIERLTARIEVLENK